MGADAARSTPTCRCCTGPDGKKLSKRHGAASVQELRDAGYLPEAVRNYLALLGWGSDERDDLLHDRGAQGALRARARLPVARRVRRAEAALDERPLPARARPSRSSPRAWRRSRADELRATSSRSPRRRSPRWPSSGRWPASSSTARPTTRPRARRCWAPTGALRRARRTRATRWPRSRGRGRRGGRGGAARRGRAARASSPSRSSSRCASRSRGRPSLRVSSRRVAVLGRDETLARIDDALDGRQAREPAESRWALNHASKLPID